MIFERQKSRSNQICSYQTYLLGMPCGPWPHSYSRLPLFFLTWQLQKPIVPDLFTPDLPWFFIFGIPSSEEGHPQSRGSVQLHRQVQAVCESLEMRCDASSAFRANPQGKRVGDDVTPRVYPTAVITSKGLSRMPWEVPKSEESAKADHLSCYPTVTSSTLLTPRN